VTIDRRTLRTLREVRWRLREQASAEHASSSQQQMKAEEILAAAQGTLEQSLEDAREVVSAARTVDELARVSQVVAAHHLCLDDATAEHAAAVATVQATAAQLRERARQALAAERLVERSDREAARREVRQEQRSQDDQRRRAPRDTRQPPGRRETKPL
jgi:flagellar biosynthesis chaperone FliJ